MFASRRFPGSVALRQSFILGNSKDGHMLRLLALGALGYAAYRYFGQQQTGASEVRLAGGPLSDRAVLQQSPDQPPAMDA